MVYHCPVCNLCRLGKGLGIAFVHCIACNYCLLYAERFFQPITVTLALCRTFLLIVHVAVVKKLVAYLWSVVCRFFDHVRSHLALPTLPIVQVTLASGAASFIDIVSDAPECGKRIYDSGCYRPGAWTR
ncbi:hemerythrin/HHE cation-binding motif-containing protein [Tanacetum coccineum]